MKAAEGDLVRIVYSCTLDDGTVFDYEENRDPLEFTLGEGGLLPVFDRIVVGMEPGEKRRERVPASDLTGVTPETMEKTLGIAAVPAEIQDAAQLAPPPSGEEDVSEVLLPGLAGARYSLASRDLDLEVVLLEIVRE